MFKNIKNLLIIILLILLLFLSGGLYYYYNKTSNISKDLSNKENLLSYLQDTVRVYKNSNNELTYEKSLLKTDIKTFKENIDLLSDNQKRLLSQVETLKKDKKDIIAAFRVKTKILVDSIKNLNAIIINDSTILFKDSTKNIEYDILITGVKPLEKPSLLIQRLDMINEQEINFYWGDKKDGYPEKFSISNSNDYFKIYDIDGYVIPELEKSVILPSNWEKVKKLFNTNYKGVLIGVGIGGATVYFLEKI